jgi:hypothetical protein
MEIIHETTGMKLKSLSSGEGYGIYFPNGKLFQMFVNRRTHKNDSYFEDWHISNCQQCKKCGTYEKGSSDCPYMKKYKVKYTEYHTESPYMVYNAAMRRFRNINKLLDKVKANQIIDVVQEA